MTARQLAEQAFALLNEGVPFEQLPLATQENYLAHAEAFLRTGTVTTRFDEACQAVVNTPRSFEAELQGAAIVLPAFESKSPQSQTAEPSESVELVESPTEPEALPEPVQPTTNKLKGIPRRGKKQ